MATRWMKVSLRAIRTVPSERVFTERAWGLPRGLSGSSSRTSPEVASSADTLPASFAVKIHFPRSSSERSAGYRGLEGGAAARKSWKYRTIVSRQSIVVSISAPAEPGVNGLFRIGLEGQVHLFSRRRGKVRRLDSLQHGLSIVSGDERRRLAAHALKEVRHFLREAVVPHLLVHREAPALRRSGLLDRVAVARLAVGLERRAVEQVGIGHAQRAVNLGSVIHAPRAR